VSAHAASPVRTVAALVATELLLTLRRGETLLATAVIPVVVLLFFASVGILPTGAGRPVDFLLPGSIALAVIATSLVSLGITTAYDRRYGVLKRLGGSPLSRGELIAAKIVVVLVVEVLQVALLLVAATVLLGWRPSGGVAPVTVTAAILLGTLAFAGIGLWLAGTLRAETMLAVANGLFIASMLLGGIVLPIGHLPGPLATVAAALPAAALSEAIRVGFGTTGDAGGPLLLLVGWAVAGVGLAAATFSWE
jgi:ABC-2 type transport system permease protein